MNNFIGYGIMIFIIIVFAVFLKIDTQIRIRNLRKFRDKEIQRVKDWETERMMEMRTEEQIGG